MRIVVTPFAIRCAGVSKHQRVRVPRLSQPVTTFGRDPSPSHTFSILDCYIRTISFPNGYSVDPCPKKIEARDYELNKKSTIHTTCPFFSPGEHQQILFFSIPRFSDLCH